MSMLPIDKKDYSDGRTKQSFKNETDVNKILERHARLGTLSHLEKWGGQYGDFSGFNFQEAQNQIARANTMFEQLPAEVRKEFNYRPDAFLDYVTDPENQNDLAEKLPALAKPGRQLPNLRQPPPEPDTPSTEPAVKPPEKPQTA